MALIEEEIAFFYFSTLYLDIITLKEYIGAYFTSIIELLYFRDENSKLEVI